MKNRFFFVLFILLTFLPYHSSHACRPIPLTSFVKFTDDMNHVFVMLRGGPDALSNKYKTPGLYRMDGSRDSVWEVEWYSPTVLPHSGGRYLVQLGNKTDMQRATGGRREPRHFVRGQLYEKRNRKYVDSTKMPHAISFYDNGKLLHEYRVGDLFDDIENLKWMNCIGSIWKLDYVLDESANIFKLATTENMSYTFSITTGELIKAEEFKQSEYTSNKAKAQNNKMQKRSSGLSDQATTELLNIIHSDWTTIEQLGEPFLSDYSLAEKIISVHGKTYRWFSKGLQDKRDLSRLAVTSGEAATIRALGAHKNDDSILLEAVKYNGNNYIDLPDHLKNIKNTLLSALPYGGMSVYNSAPEDLRNNREVLVTALRSQLIIMRSGVARNPRFRLGDLGSIPAEYLKDERVKRMVDALLEIFSAPYALPMAEIHREEAYSLIKKRSAER